MKDLTEDEKKGNIDLDKGLVEIDIREQNLESKNVKVMLGIIKERKNRLPKPGQRNIDDLEVNLNFEEENSDEDNLIINNVGKNDSMLIESNIY